MKFNIIDYVKYDYANIYLAWNFDSIHFIILNEHRDLFGLLKGIYEIK